MTLSPRLRPLLRPLHRPPLRWTAALVVDGHLRQEPDAAVVLQVHPQQRPGRHGLEHVGRQRERAVAADHGEVLAPASLGADPAVADGDGARQPRGDLGVVRDRDDRGADRRLTSSTAASTSSRPSWSSWLVGSSSSSSPGRRPARRRPRAAAAGPGVSWSERGAALRRRGRPGRAPRAGRAGRVRAIARPPRWAKRTLSSGEAYGSRLRMAPCRRCRRRRRACGPAPSRRAGRGRARRHAAARRSAAAGRRAGSAGSTCPTPDGPSSPTTSPAAMSRSTPDSATTSLPSSR